MKKMRPRVIPLLLLQGTGFVKTKKFSNPRYVGDAVNTLKIFNEKGADEIIVVDINASRENKPPNIDLISTFAEELFVPLGYGGGISELDQINRLISAGIEKIVLNSINASSFRLVEEASNRFGSQAVVGVVDHGTQGFFRRKKTVHHGSKMAFDDDPITHAKKLVDAGVGELLVQGVDQDGMKTGYDIAMLKAVSDAVNVPVIAGGGAGKLEDFASAIREGGAAAVSAGSMFVFHGKLDGVLINYPDDKILNELFE